MQETSPAVAGAGRAPSGDAAAEACASLATHIEAALTGRMTLAALDTIMRTIWSACVAGDLTEAEAERLDGMVRARRAPVLEGRRPQGADFTCPMKPPRPRSPDRRASIERRRRVAASGAVPPEIAAQFTLGEIAVLSVVGREAARGCPVCDWPMDKIAALAGVSRTVARGALRLAQTLGLLRVRERRRQGARSDTNVVSITAETWWRWLKRTATAAAKGTRRTGGCGNQKATYTKELGNKKHEEPRRVGLKVRWQERGPGFAGPTPMTEQALRQAAEPTSVFVGAS